MIFYAPANASFHRKLISFKERAIMFPLLKGEMLGVFLALTSHPFLPVGARGLREVAKYKSISFLLSINKEEQHGTTY
jgi:hypothetical protein